MNWLLKHLDAEKHELQVVAILFGWLIFCLLMYLATDYWMFILIGAAPGAILFWILQIVGTIQLIRKHL